MKVAKKFRKSRPKTSGAMRATLTLPKEACGIIDELRGTLRRSAFVQQLVAREKKKRVEREAFIAAVNASYTPEVIAETLRVNAEFPIHGEM